MDSVLKFLLFAFFFFVTAFSGYRSYRYFNNKIKASRKGWHLILNIFLLILLNCILFFASLVILIQLYFYLKN